MPHVDAILARLLALHPKRIDLSLDRMWRVLERLGNPERRLPPVIHVAGTNGKGSTVAFLRAMLEASGRSVHVYTSPNLVRVNERFRLGGVLVSDAELADALDRPQRCLPPVIHVAGTNGKGSTIAFMRAILEAAGLRFHVYTSPHLVRFNERFRLGQPEGGRLATDTELAGALLECETRNAEAPITVFEIETAAAFLVYARNPADVLLLEVGLGGRLDATNVIERPLASVITPVSMDHMDFLGDTLEKIATEKAAILKRGVPAVAEADA